MKKTLSLLALAALVSASAYAESGDTPPAPAREFSETVSENLGELRTLTEAKRFAEAGKLLATLLAGAAEPSFDRVALSQIQAQVFIAENRYAEAVGPLLYALRTGESQKFVDAPAARELLALLSRIHYRLAQDEKTAGGKAGLLETALTEYRQALRRTGTVGAADRLYLASLLLEQGSVDEVRPDTAKLEAALAETRESLRLAVVPAADARPLELAILLRLGRREEAVGVLELLLKQQPSDESHWRRLIATHLALTSEASGAASRPHYLRALLAYERAQQGGLLVAPRDNRSVIGILLALDRLDAAAVKLTGDLSSGAIEDTPANRELLASTLLRADKAERAEAAYAEAIRRFPKEAGPELALGRLLYSRDDFAGAYAHLEKAVAKDGAPDPGRNRFFLAFLAYELRRYEDSTRWAEAAKAFPDADAGEIARLTHAAKAALKEAANG